MSISAESPSVMEMNGAGCSARRFSAIKLSTFRLRLWTARIEPPKPGSFETCLQAHMTNASRVFARQCRRFSSSRVTAAFRSTCDSAAKSSRDVSSVSNQCWTLVLCRVVVLGGLEPFVFVKSIFILFSFWAKKSPDPNGSSVWQSLRFTPYRFTNGRLRRLVEGLLSPSLLIPMSVSATVNKS